MNDSDRREESHQHNEGQSAGGSRENPDFPVDEGATNQKESPAPEEQIDESLPEVETETPEALPEVRLEIKDRHIAELHEEIAELRLAADEAQSVREAGDERLSSLDGEQKRLRERIRELEDAARARKRRREGQERRIARLEREIERREEEIERLEGTVLSREQEQEQAEHEAEDLIARKDAALDDALRRVGGLERDLDEREAEVAELRATIGRLRAELDIEHEIRRRLAEPANRLRAGIDRFNDSEHPQTISSISRSMGQPEVNVSLDQGDEPQVHLTFTWSGVSWRTYAADPGFAVEEPRVYMIGAGENLSGVDQKPPNARIGPGGRVMLGL